jgi:hypothetical protein
MSFKTKVYSIKINSTMLMDKSLDVKGILIFL